MKGKKVKTSAGVVIVMLIFFAHEKYQEYKLEHEQKQGKIIEMQVEKPDFDDFFVPVDENSNKKGGK